MSDCETSNDDCVRGKPPGDSFDPSEQFSLFRTYFDRKLDFLKKKIISETSSWRFSSKKEENWGHCILFQIQ